MSLGRSNGKGKVMSAIQPANSSAAATAADTVASSTSTSTASTDNSTITANDFLTLLVTEMKNQDPTQPTDPNEYIQQLVQVNSLQQLIGINQGITSLDTAAGATTTSTSAV
jgi:flagellar basal-body rod modification protein FlgD